MMKFVLLAVVVLSVSACGGDKSESAAKQQAATAAAGAQAEASGSADVNAGEYGKIIDHTRDAAEFELRRSIGGLDRMIDQYTADGYATDELQAEKAKKTASLDALLGKG